MFCYNIAVEYWKIIALTIILSELLSSGVITRDIANTGVGRAYVVQTFSSSKISDKWRNAVVKP